MSQLPEKPSCCLPARDVGGVSKFDIKLDLQASQQAQQNAVPVPGGAAWLGTDRPKIIQDGEAPLKTKRISAFRISQTTITNDEFKAFVDQTGYVTEAERIGWSFVFWSRLNESVGPTQAVANAPWWRVVHGANWRDIDGPDTYETVWRGDHPVVHVSWNDASAYCAWVGGRLPSEAEWEHAARGGLGDVMFPWGDAKPNDTDFQPCNIWQGQFPKINTAMDGFLTTAPAKSFEANGFGLYNVVGNVWEWTSEPFRIRSLKKDVKARLHGMKGYKLSKGGSYLCHETYCFRYRIAARSGTSPDSATPHHGFRVVWPD